jgi:CelD/BcsL family acetyltransferase involved in cellulose biosynthesis
MTDITRAGREVSQLSASVLSVEEAAQIWSGFAETDPCGVAQMLPWVQAWKDCVNPDIFAAIVKDGSEAVLLLPLEIIRDKGVTIARYIGGSHANANFPLLNRDAAVKLTSSVIRSLFLAIKAARPQIDALALTRQLREFGGIANPLLAFGSSESPNLSLSFALGPDFEALAKERGWSRKQKKMRNQARRLEDRGGWVCVSSDDPDSALRLMDRFFMLKAARFKEFGQKNTFAEEGVENFFRRLFRQSAASGKPQFQLDGLSVNGDLLAVSGSVFKHGAVMVEFGAVDGAETSLSPGDFLYHQMIKRACADGYDVFDLGVGDEPYKRSWCDIETHHRDSAFPFTARGRAYVAVFKLAAAAKRAIKRNTALFALVKKWRARKAEKPTAATAD